MAKSRGRPFVWYELLTTDVAGAKAFYGKVVDWGARNVSTPSLTYNLFTVGDAPVAGLMNLPSGVNKTGPTPYWMGYVAVDNVDATTNRIVELGGIVRVPPTDVGDLSRFSIIADPQEATLALVKGTKPPQTRAAEQGALGHIGWHELLADNQEEAFAFYNALFGWQRAGTHVGAMGAYQLFSINGETAGGMFSKPPTLPLSFWLYYINVSNIESAAQRVEASGGEILYGPIDVPGGAWVVHCRDPQGTVFGLLDRRSRKAIEHFISRAQRERKS